MYIYLFSSALLVICKFFILYPHPLLFYTLICNIIAFFIYMYISYYEVCKLIFAIETNQELKLNQDILSDNDIDKYTKICTWNDILQVSGATDNLAPFSTSKQCAICFDKYVNMDTIRILQCGHMYHTVCIDKWLKRKILCPTCSARIDHQSSSIGSNLCRIRTVPHVSQETS